MVSGPECTDHLFVDGETLLYGWCTTKAHGKGIVATHFQLSSHLDKVTVACALYCDNRLCWGSKRHRT